jgi:hypothetical protein
MLSVSAATLSTFRQFAPVGSVLNYSDIPDTALPLDAQQGLGWVFGTGVESTIAANTQGPRRWITSGGRVRIGGGTRADRDFLVGTHVLQSSLRPGNTIAARQMTLTGELGTMAAEARGWVNDVEMVGTFPGDTPGTAIRMIAATDGSQVSVVPCHPPVLKGPLGQPTGGLVHTQPGAYRYFVYKKTQGVSLGTRGP